jgi:hypothetical protein
MDDWTQVQRASPESYLCKAAAEPITVDGQLSEDAWRSAAWTRDFQDIEGPSKPAPRFRTRAKMLWDRDYFYIGAELQEPHIWGVITNHDAVIFQDPDFEVFIDPDGDRHNYYEFEMNALNTGWDLLLKKPYIDGGPALNAWEIPDLKTAVHIRGTLNNPSDTDESWSVEIAIPWKVLAEFSKQKAPPAEGDIWRVNFSRVEWQIEMGDGKYQKVAGKKEDNWVWSPMGIIDMHRPENWGFVKFIRGTSPDFHAPRGPRRDALLSIYYAQKDYFSKNKRWAASVEELFKDSAPPPVPANSPAVKMTATSNGFRASLNKLNIREDGLLSEEPPE